MRTDPRVACANKEEKLLWALVHDFISHPLMAITLYSKPSLQFHDFTSHRAWPRVKPADRQPFTMQSRGFGPLQVQWLGGEIYAFNHPAVSHVFTANASDAVEALEKAEAHFRILADEFGGAFARPAQ